MQNAYPLSILFDSALKYVMYASQLVRLKLCNFQKHFFLFYDSKRNLKKMFVEFLAYFNFCMITPIAIKQ